MPPGGVYISLMINEDLIKHFSARELFTRFRTWINFVVLNQALVFGNVLVHPLFMETHHSGWET